MGMTLTEKILSAHCDSETVRPGDYILADVDICLGNDITAPIAITEFEKAGFTEVWDRERIALVPDHFTPNKDIKAATLAAVLRDFARKHALTHYWEVGRVGIEHALLPEQGVVGPGDLMIGADSHTCTHGALGAFATGVGSTDMAACMATGKVWLRVPESMRFVFTGRLPRWVGGKDLILYTIGRIGVDGALYRAMEFCGPVVEALSMDERMAMCNMAIEAGGKSGIVAPDETTRAYCEGRLEREARYYESDPDAVYAEVHEWDVSGLSPQVAAPSLPSNAGPVEDYAGTKIDQVVIGSCTNGRISDLRQAAGILKSRKVAPHVRLIVFPATQAVYRQASEEGLLEVLIDAEAAVSTPTCGPCLGGHMGVLAAGERALATTNRNFRSRMGDPGSEVYLCGPAVAAASAVAGTIVHPDQVVGCT
ncbi:MAG: 3-isopropylmalate dehydratase large subunit [Candidatus Brocadiia bacterium]|jgi:3-isopropylmalate/(R)-2-methylmalate dehydratase large subunit|nr:3-isopropylmalate dehydratase large subunit [Candidatus Brocadiia bacterium]